MKYYIFIAKYYDFIAPYYRSITSLRDSMNRAILAVKTMKATQKVASIALCVFLKNNVYCGVILSPPFCHP